MGKSARKVEEGRWVNAIVLMLPSRFESDAATRFDRDAMKEVVKNVSPKVEGSRWNFVVK